MLSDDDTEQKKAIIAKFMGFELFKSCKIPTAFYQKLEDLEIADVWVRGATDEFRKTPCTSEDYWNYRMRQSSSQQWDEKNYSLNYDSSYDSLMPIVHRLSDVINEHDQAFAGLSLFELGLFSSLDDIFEATIEAIEWHNNQKK